MPSIQRQSVKPSSKVKALAKPASKKKVVSKSVKVPAKKTAQAKAKPSVKMSAKSAVKPSAKKKVVTKASISPKPAKVSKAVKPVAKSKPVIKQKVMAKSSSKTSVKLAFKPKVAAKSLPNSSPKRALKLSPKIAKTVSRAKASDLVDQVLSDKIVTIQPLVGVDVYFGLEGFPFVDVTDRVIEKCSLGTNDIWALPMEDFLRTNVFGDPVPNRVKKVFVRTHALDSNDLLEKVVLVGEKGSFQYSGGTLKFSLSSYETEPASSSASVHFGLEGYSLVDVTNKVIDRCIHDKDDNGLWSLPKEDTSRTRLFGDPVPNRVKKITVRTQSLDGVLTEKFISADESCTFSFEDNILALHPES